MKIEINNTKELKKIRIHDGKEVLEELELPEGTAIITNGEIIKGTEKEQKDKIKELNLKELTKPKTL